MIQREGERGETKCYFKMENEKVCLDVLWLLVNVSSRQRLHAPSKCANCVLCRESCRNPRESTASEWASTRSDTTHEMKRKTSKNSLSLSLSILLFVVIISHAHNHASNVHFSLSLSPSLCLGAVRRVSIEYVREKEILSLSLHTVLLSRTQLQVFVLLHVTHLCVRLRNRRIISPKWNEKKTLSTVCSYCAYVITIYCPPRERLRAAAATATSTAAIYQ